MSSSPTDKDLPEPSELDSLASRLEALDRALEGAEKIKEDEAMKGWDAAAAGEPVSAEAPTALPVNGEAEGTVAEGGPSALSVEEAAPGKVPAAPPPRFCPICNAQRQEDHIYCNDCGFMFPEEEPAATATAPAGGEAIMRVKTRYEFGKPFAERLGVTRHKGIDRGLDGASERPIVVIRRPVASSEPAPTAELVAEPVDADADAEILPDFDELPPSALPVTESLPAAPQWPSPTWEEKLLDSAGHPALPAVLDSFAADGYEYLIEELPTGQLLWDAWDDPEASAEKRFGLLRQVAEALQALHQAGAMLEGLRPDIVVVSEEGRARITDLADLLPLLVPPGAPIRGRLYSAPELIAAPEQADARADLYSFGAMLYALHVGRELIDKDFEREGSPKPFLPQWPDIHPHFGRLMSKTFCRDVAQRFPTDESAKHDPTGFTDLLRALDTCGRTLDNVRLEVACWTTTGMVRTGNEDAFAILHAAESRQDDLGESCLVLLCDGMGGYEAGEVAAAMALQVMRRNLLAQKPFAALAGASPFPSELPGHEPEAPRRVDPEECKKFLAAALKDANKQIYTASRSGKGRRGMGCTAEAVYVDGRHVVVGHVGDSRTYHLHEGSLIQLTRDQTLVNRLVELGTLSPKEAENHPRRHELQQALGGQPDVEPGLYVGTLKPGDWVVVCSDGLSNHCTNDELTQMLRYEATSAEMAARRLVNWVNINGATDNATIVVIRAT
jgi:serine/threonine protein phosphatase PrpC